MVKKTVLSLFAFSLLAACGGASGPTASDLAGEAAKVYYEQLLHGDYAGFVDGTYQPDSIPQGYREQLIANAKMFVGQQKEEHRGITAVCVVSATADTTHHVATVYLSLSYGDSSSEQVAVPMVERRGVWYMR